MKILTDLGHPKNIHVLKNVIPLLKQKGHELHCLYREREHVKDLCHAFNISGINRGTGASGIFAKLVYLIKTDFQLFKLAKKIKPDLLLSFASPYLANLALFGKIPMVVFDDTEQNGLVQRIYTSRSNAIIVPSCFKKTLSGHQFSFDGYYELGYLSPRYFRPEPLILQKLGLPIAEKYVLLRFVSWQAVHDFRHCGLDNEEKQKLVAVFSEMARVFISAEGALPAGLESLRLNIPSNCIHQVMAGSALVFSEGATMAAEAAVLGVPSIYCSDLRTGYIEELEKRYDLLHSFPRKTFMEALARGTEILQEMGKNRKSRTIKRETMLAQSIDVAEFMAWFIDRFPESVEIMSADPQFSKRFMAGSGR